MRGVIQESNDLISISRAHMTSANHHTTQPPPTPNLSQSTSHIPHHATHSRTAPLYSPLYAPLPSLRSYARGGQLPVEILPALYLEQGAVNWNKRCALAYLDERINRIQQLWWQTNGLLNNTQHNTNQTNTTSTTTTTTTASSSNNTHLAPHELQYFNDYNRLILNYIQRTDLPLTADQLPPRAVWLTVEVLREGRIEGSDGTPMELKAGNRKRMRRMDAENLVRQGIVRVVNDSVV